MAKGKHPVPFRTRKLSPSAPMVLRGGPRGRVGRRRTSSVEAAPSRERPRLRCPGLAASGPSVGPGLRRDRLQGPLGAARGGAEPAVRSHEWPSVKSGARAWQASRGRAAGAVAVARGGTRAVRRVPPGVRAVPAAVLTGVAAGLPARDGPAVQARAGLVAPGTTALGAAALAALPGGPIRPAPREPGDRVPADRAAVRPPGGPRVQAPRGARAQAVPGMAVRAGAAGMTAARTGAARRVAHVGAGQVRPAATPPGPAREHRAALPVAIAPALFATVPQAIARGRAVPGRLVVRVLMALVRPVPAGMARVAVVCATTGPAAAARVRVVPGAAVRGRVGSATTGRARPARRPAAWRRSP